MSDMNFDDIVKQASEAADKAPRMTPLQRAPFEHLRPEFHAAFREARGEALPEAAYASDRDAAARPIQFVLRLAARALEILDDSLSFSGLDVAAVAARSVGGEAQVSGDLHLLKELAGGFEVRLVFAGEGSLNVDMFRGGTPYRPFSIALTTDDGLAIAEEVECTLPVASIMIPVQSPGVYTLHINHADLSHHITYEVRQN